MKIKQMEPSFGEEEKNAVSEYFDSGGWLTEHTKTREFEKLLADYIGTKYCSVVSNGTVSLVTALLAHGVKPGDEVIVPAYTMGATAMAVSLIGAKPVLVDIERETLGMYFNYFRNSVTPKTKAVMLVGINGRFPRYGEDIIGYCRDNNIAVIEDSAQCLGSFHEGKHIGTFGSIGSFSFSTPKIISTGQGGCLVTDDKELYEKICMIKNFGRKESGSDDYQCVGSNFKFTDLQAVVGIEQMKKLNERVKIKKHNYFLYEQELNGVEGVSLIDTYLDETTPWMNDVLITSTKGRKNVMKELRKSGIETREFYPALHNQKPYLTCKPHPCANIVSSEGVWLPSSVKLTEKEIIYVCDTIKKVI